MLKRIRIRFIFLNLFILLCFLSSLVIIVCCAREYDFEVTVALEPDTHPADVQYELSKDNIEVSDIRMTDTSVLFTVKPLSMGECDIDMMIGIAGQTEPSYQHQEVFAGPFGTVFVHSPLFDFKGSIYVIQLIVLDLLVITVLTILSFFDYLRKSDFGYPMVACGGIGLFCLFYLFLNIVSALALGDTLFVTSYIKTFGGYLYQLSNLCTRFAYFTAPFMLIFSLALTVSNLFLIRREGFRFVNLLGILFGVLWIGGFALFYLLDYNISGSEEYVAFISSLSGTVATLISYFECMLFSTILSAFLASRHKPPFDRDYIVILGCAIRKDGTLTPLLKGRVDAALSFAQMQKEKTGKPVRFVPSGGQGSDESVSEGEAMKRYLVEQGVEETMILPETKSTNTNENIRFSKEVIENDTNKAYNAAFATTNYHIFRGYILSKKNDLSNAQGISAKTKWYFFPNAFLRELVGLVVDEKKIHILVVSILVIVFALLNISTFL